MFNLIMFPSTKRTKKIAKAFHRKWPLLSFLAISWPYFYIWCRCTTFFLSKIDLCMSEVATEREAVNCGIREPFGITWAFQRHFDSPPSPLKKCSKSFCPYWCVALFVSPCFKIASSICHELDEEIQSLMTKIEEQNDPGKAGICMACLWKRGKDLKH